MKNISFMAEGRLNVEDLKNDLRGYYYDVKEYHYPEKDYYPMDAVDTLNARILNPDTGERLKPVAAYVGIEPSGETSAIGVVAMDKEGNYYNTVGYNSDELNEYIRQDNNAAREMMKNNSQSMGNTNGPKNDMGFHF